MRGFFLINTITGDRTPYRRMIDVADQLKVSATLVFNILHNRSVNKQMRLAPEYQIIPMSEDEYNSHFQKIHPKAMWHCDVCARDYTIANKSPHLISKKHTKKLPTPPVVEAVVPPTPVNSPYLIKRVEDEKFDS